MSSIFRRNVSQKNVGGHPGDEQKRRVSSTHRQEPTESSCSTEYDPGLCLSQNTGLTSGILRRKVAKLGSQDFTPVYMQSRLIASSESSGVFVEWLSTWAGNSLDQSSAFIRVLDELLFLWTKLDRQSLISSLQHRG